MINKQKKVIRQQIKEAKKKLSQQEKKARSTAIFQKVEQMEAFQKARKVMAYWSLPDEVATHDFVKRWAKDKSMILPVVKGDVLELRSFTGMQDMKPEPVFGIYEPTGPIEPDPSSIDLIIVPGVAFDPYLNRLGRGKAYYDKLLKSTHALKVGVCFDVQLIAEVPTDAYDIPMDRVITETVEK
ncbi:MAG: 5-formyltetrahydrofolate cyclo-ligase [Bacteroidota bacterium]